MAAVIEKRINWRKTLTGMEIGDFIVKKKPAPRLVSLARNWASILKKSGYLFKVSLQGDTLTISREL